MGETLDLWLSCDALCGNATRMVEAAEERIRHASGPVNLALLRRHRMTDLFPLFERARSSSSNGEIESRPHSSGRQNE